MKMKKAMICGLLIGSAVITSGWMAPEQQYSEHEYTVQRGDTLWNIAEANCGETYILEYMDDLKARNPELRKNHGQIHAGDRIVVLKHES